MTWTVSFTPDGNETVGTAVATWNQGQPDEFVYQLRINADDDFALFVQSAYSAQQESVDTAQRLADIKTSMEAKLQAAFDSVSGKDADQVAALSLSALAEGVK